MTFYQRLQDETEQARQYLYAAPILADVAEGRIDLEHYIRFLANAYHHVSHTVRLMMASGSRLGSDNEWLLPALIEYINEEVGHERWIAEDIQACGIDAKERLAQSPGHAVAALVSYVYHYIERVNPMGMLGMVYVLEGTSTALATETARLVQQHLGLPDSAFTYLRSHGDLDIEHVQFFEGVVNQIRSESDRQAVIEVANRVFHLYGDVIRDAGRAEVRYAA